MTGNIKIDYSNKFNKQLRKIPPPIPTEKPLPVSGTILPMLGSFVAGLLLVFVSLAVLF